MISARRTCRRIGKWGPSECHDHVVAAVADSALRGTTRQVRSTVEVVSPEEVISSLLEHHSTALCIHAAPRMRMVVPSRGILKCIVMGEKNSWQGAAASK